MGLSVREHGSIVRRLVLSPPNSGHLVPSAESLILKGFANEFHRNDEAGDPSIGGGDESLCVYQREKNFSIL